VKGADEPAIAPRAPEEIAEGVVEAEVEAEVEAAIIGGVAGAVAGILESTGTPILTTPFGLIEVPAAWAAAASAAAIARFISRLGLSVLSGLAAVGLAAVGAAGGFWGAIAGRSASDKFLLTMTDAEPDSEAVGPSAKSVGGSRVALWERKFEPEGG
jgi:uncharacterized membrane protein YfcA